MVNMRAAANSHHSRIPAAAAVCVCVRSCPAIAGHAEALAIFPRSSQILSARYVGKSDSESVLVHMEVMWDGGSVVCVVAVNCRVAARRLRAM